MYKRNVWATPLVLFIALFLSISVISSANAQIFLKNDILDLQYREVELSNACTYYDSKFTELATINDIYAGVKQMDWINEKFVKDSGWEYLAELYQSVPKYVVTEVCEDTVQYDAGNKTTIVEVCSSKELLDGYEQEKYYSWLPYEWDTNTKHLRFCAELKPIVGERQIEHIPDLFGYRFTEYDWWNVSWDNDLNFTIINTNTTDTRPNSYTVSMPINHSEFLDSGFCYDPAGNDLRVVYNGTYELPRYNLTGWNTENTTIIFRLFNTIAPNQNDSLYALYCGNSDYGNLTPPTDLSLITDAWDDVVAYYPLDTQNYFDLTGNYDLSIQNGVPTNTTHAVFGNSSVFGQAGYYLYHDTLLDTIPWAGFSTELWGQAGYLTAQHSHISKKNTGAPYRMYQIEDYNAGGANYSRIYISGGGTSAVVSNSIDPGQWKHYVGFLYNNGTEGLCVNEECTTADDTAMTNGTDGNLIIGGYSQNPASAGYIGNIDNVAIYSKVLSKDEIDKLRQRHIPIPTYTVMYPLLGFEYDTPPTPPTPPAPEINTTIVPDVRYCIDDYTLYESTYEQITVLNVTNATLTERFQHCENGCRNSTIMALGDPGCVENEFQQYLILFAVIVIMFTFIGWVLKHG